MTSLLRPSCVSSPAIKHMEPADSKVAAKQDHADVFLLRLAVNF